MQVSSEPLMLQTPTPTDLLQQLAMAIDESAEDYNQLVDAYEQQGDSLETAHTVIALMQNELNELREKADYVTALQDRVDSLVSGNSLLMTQLNERNAELKKTKTAFDVAVDKAVKSTAKLKEVESELKSIKQHGDPKKLIAANKTLRDRNLELMKQNDLFKLRAIEATDAMEKLLERAGPSAVIPSYSNEGENIYLHPKPLQMVRDGKVMSLIALTFWNDMGIGRVVTWDSEKEQPHFASVGHKTVNEKLKPSEEALDWVCDWFRTNIVTVGDKQTFITKYQIKTKGKK